MITELKVKRVHADAKLPTRRFPLDAGLDLYALGTVTAWNNHVTIRTGIAVEIPPGCVGLIMGKSGLASGLGVDVLGGVIDSGYTAEVGVVLSFPDYGMTINAGDAIAQLVIQKVELPSVVEVDDLAATERGDDGLGRRRA